VDERDKRLASNEALFREVNERVDDVAVNHGAGNQHYLCECSNVDCTFQVQLERSEYEAVRANGKQFFVLPGHYTPEIEALVSKNERFWVVEKSGEAAAFVEHLDPRTR
jgi:putative NIF3 family GTP cyclohydrolase 1 type 2